MVAGRKSEFSIEIVPGGELHTLVNINQDNDLWKENN